MKATHKVEIGGTTYSIYNWDVDKSLLTLVWLTKTFGEGFVGLFTSKAGSEFLFGAGDEPEKESGGDDDDDMLIPTSSRSDDDDAKVIQEFISRIIDRLDERTYLKYSKHILDGVRIGTTKINYGAHFVGKMALLHRLMFEVLRFQYGDFLGDSPGEDS